MKVELFMKTESQVNNVERMGLNTQPCGLPVFRVWTEEM